MSFVKQQHRAKLQLQANDVFTNEREWFMHETQYTQQTATRTAQNQDKKQHECKWLQKHRRTAETNKHLLRERWKYRLVTVSDKCHWGA